MTNKQSEPVRKQSVTRSVEERLLSAETNVLIELDAVAMARGIGRKATDEELINYLNKDIDEDGIPLEQAFSKYSNL